MEDLKLLIAGLLSPFWIALLLQATGISLVRGKRQVVGLRLLVGGFAVLVLGSLSGFTFEARRAAEFQYPPFDVRSYENRHEGNQLICVLGTGFNPDATLPANSRVSGAFLSRLLEGVRLYRAFPSSRLVISVAGKASVVEKELFLSDILQLLQMDSQRVHLITEARSTLDEAMETKALRKDEQVIVVTSAGHMPRAMLIFTQEGLNPKAAPSDYGFVRKGGSRDKILPRWVPSTDGLITNHLWLYEKVASIWQAIRPFP
ncbi:MAG: YdcF family protein [Planctomycetaceae bacterium]|nr:YdcF family protein [Planctomycetaceae bacterium]